MLMELQEASTPLVRAGRVFTKLEMFNRAGSHKARAAQWVVRQAIEAGHLIPGGPRRILEKSGGNFGIGLAYEARKFDIGVDLVVGLSFSRVKMALCEEFGARLVGRDMLLRGAQPKEVVEKLLEDQPQNYFYTDQFSNPANLAAHFEGTGPELLAQLLPLGALDRPVVFVVAAGTGASAAGISRRLKAALPNVTVVLNEPEHCSYIEGVFGDHVQKGTAVGVRPPFLDLTLVDHIERVTDAQAREGQRMFAAATGLYPGPSSGGNYFLARRWADACPTHLVVTLIYDSGEGYLEVAPAKEICHVN